MFVKLGRHGYTQRDGSQFAQGQFLILMTYWEPKEGSVLGTPQPMRALVRFVAMHQLGHFMMGHAMVAGHRVSLSGTYGADGLTVDVVKDVYDQGLDVPAELVEAWKKGGDHNPAGSEAQAMVDWAMKVDWKKHARSLRVRKAA